MDWKPVKPEMVKPPRVDDQPPVARIVRKTRSDKGKIMATRRDQFCITWIAEQYAARVDQVQKLLSKFPDPARPFKQPGVIAETTTKDQIARWQRAGWIEYRRVLADEPGYVWVTRKGLQLVDLDQIYTAKEPASTRLNHIYAVNEVRFAEERYLWKSERRYRSEQQAKLKKDQKLGPLPDGILITKNESQIAVEVEISEKKPKELLKKLEALVYAYGSGGIHKFPLVWVYVSSERIQKSVFNAVDDLRMEDQKRISVAGYDNLIPSRYR